ncbi:hypothetical protein OUZ56_010415 [Daphnia magna]|uniref:Uncharacterized protein n=1 Tax=Daphnia magna TaxID=35525 RepID=A0ABR0AIL7_9CRUS|nr:hypothetical protein OUZ56_010415 [Daphnia magna]
MSGGTGFDDLRLQGQQLLTTDLMTLRPEIIHVDFFRKCQLLSTFNADCEGRRHFFDRQFSHGWLATYRLSSGVCHEPPAPSDSPLDPQQTRIPSYAVINRVVFVLHFDSKDSNYVYVTFLRLCDLVPNILLRQIEFQERWTFVEFHQLVDVLRVDASTTQDLSYPIVHECFKSASAGMDPTKTVSELVWKVTSRKSISSSRQITRAMFRPSPAACSSNLGIVKPFTGVTHDEGYVDLLVLEDEAEIRHSPIYFCACIHEYMQVLLPPTFTLMSET